MLARISNYFETFRSQEYPLPYSEKDKLDDYFNKNIVNSKNDKENYTQMTKHFHKKSQLSSQELYIRDLANSYLESCGLYQNKDRFVIELWRYRCFGDKTTSPFSRHKDSFGLILAPINTCIFYIRKDTTVIGGDLELFGLPPYGRLISKPIKKINTDDCKVFAFDGNVIHRVTSMSGFGNRDCIVVQFEKKV